MGRALLTVAWLLLGFGMLQMGNALQGTVLSVRGGLEGFADPMIGAIMSAFFGGMAVGTQLAPMVIDRAGHTRTFAAFASIASAATLVHVVFIDPYIWLGVRAVTGFCFAGLVMVVESWLNAAIDTERRGRLMSVYAITGLGAGALGQLLLPLADAGGFELFALVSIILSIALVPVAISRAEAPLGEEEQAHPSLIRLWRTTPFGFVGSFMIGACIGSFFGLGPLFAQQIGFEQSGVSAFMAAGTGAAMLLQWPLGWLSDKINRRRVVVAISALTTAACALAFVWSLPAGVMVLGLGAVIGGLMLPSHSLISSHVYDRASRNEMVAVSGAMVVLHGAGAALGPLLSGTAMGALGPNGLLLVLGGAQAVICLTGLGRMVVRRGSRPQERFAGTSWPAVDGALEEPRPAKS
jgi:MFS family permease